MKTRTFLAIVLFAAGLVSATFCSYTSSEKGDLYSQNWKKTDSTDSNGGGCPIPPIGH